jgi:hypothetical protein
MALPRSLVSVTLGVFALVTLTAIPAAAQCPPFICYVDLVQGASICPNDPVYPAASRNIAPIVIDADNPNCTPGPFAAVVQVNIPDACTGVSVLVEYGGLPDGWTVNIGDSPTNNGFAGDSGSLPTGQNAEVQILDEDLSVYSAASAPPVDRLATAHLALTDGWVRFVVKDQYLSWGQPFSDVETPSLGKLFFIPTPPVTAPANRTIYVGLNRVILPVGAPSSSRNGCGARHALIFTQ